MKCRQKSQFFRCEQLEQRQLLTGMNGGELAAFDNAASGDDVPAECASVRNGVEKFAGDNRISKDSAAQLADSLLSDDVPNAIRQGFPNGIPYNPNGVVAENVGRFVKSLGDGDLTLGTFGGKRIDPNVAARLVDKILSDDVPVIESGFPNGVPGWIFDKVLVHEEFQPSDAVNGLAEAQILDAGFPNGIPNPDLFDLAEARILDGFPHGIPNPELFDLAETRILDGFPHGIPNPELFDLAETRILDAGFPYGIPNPELFDLAETRILDAGFPYGIPNPEKFGFAKGISELGNVSDKIAGDSLGR